MNLIFPGQKVQYKGRGFPGFDEEHTEMEIVKVRKIDILVLYKSKEISVLRHEIAEYGGPSRQPSSTITK